MPSECNRSEIILSSPADFHVHLRQGDLCKSVVSDVRKGGIHLAYVMPNLQPPITTTDQAIAYRNELQSIDSNVQYLMTLYLSPSLTPEEIRKARQAGVVGVKSYPRGVTTNSESGIEDYEFYYPVFEAMQEEGLVLNLHGEVPSNASTNTCVMNAEVKFLPQLAKLHAAFPRLRIVLEHATTKDAVEMVMSLGETVACTITAHHLAIIVDDWAGQSLHYCKPVAKFPADREALREVVRSGKQDKMTVQPPRFIAAGHPRFFLGSDSAPHPSISKTTSSPSQGCAAGVYTSPFLLPLLAHLMESFGALDKLENFVSLNGRAFYGFPVSDANRVVKLRRGTTLVRASGMKRDVVPFWDGKELGWELLETVQDSSSR